VVPNRKKEDIPATRGAIIHDMMIPRTLPTSNHDSGCTLDEKYVETSTGAASPSIRCHFPKNLTSGTDGFHH
jgi:hypothetical protein